MKVAALDTLWGTTLFGIVAFIVINLFNGSAQSEDF
jgi:hypothetical protein